MAAAVAVTVDVVGVPMTTTRAAAPMADLVATVEVETAEADAVEEAVAAVAGASARFDSGPDSLLCAFASALCVFARN